MIAIQSIWAA